MQKQYIGTKIIKAEPMTRADAEAKLGRNIGGDKHGDGYLVEYEDGYQSWSPADAFDAAYRPAEAMNFGLAIEAMRKGLKVARSGWNGKGMWLKLVPTELADAVAFQYAALSAYPWVGMKTADDKFVPWLASQTDILADDWQIVD